MLFELFHVILQKILHDKIILGLIAILILGALLNSVTVKKQHDEQPLAQQQQSASATGSQEVAQRTLESQGEHTSNSGDGQQAAAATTNPADVEPALATDFVKWWISYAMDYTAASAQQSHEQAFQWMSTEAAAAFQNSFWSPTTASGITSGQIVAAFHPAQIQSIAKNPDGSVVVRVTGALISQASGQPMTQNLVADLLIRREENGLRIAGLYCRG